VEGARDECRSKDLASADVLTVATLLMKSRLRRILTLLLALFTAPASLLAADKTSFASKPSPLAAGKFEVRAMRGWPHGAPAELAQLHEQHRLASARNASPEELVVFISALNAIEQRMPYLLEIRSGGGPLSALLAAVAREEGVAFELINAAEPSDLEVPLPAFHLRNANWGTIIGVLESFLASRGLSLRHVGGDNPNLNEAKSVVCVLRRIAPPDDPKRGLGLEFVSFQVAENISDAQPIEVIVDAIRTAWELDPAHDPAALRVKFHPGTKILLISGPNSAPKIAEQVVRGLRKNPVHRP
jgi:hypothetical protein